MTDATDRGEEDTSLNGIPPTEDTAEPTQDEPATMKRLIDSQAHITTLEEENRTFRDQLARMQGQIELLANGRDQGSQQPAKPEPTFLDALTEQMKDDAFLDEIDANPRKMVNLLVTAAQELRKEQDKAFFALGGRDQAIKSSLLQEVDGRFTRLPEEMSRMQEVQQYQSVIEKLKTKPAYKDLPLGTLLEMAKDMSGDSTPAEPSSPMFGRASRRPQVTPQQTQRDYAVGLQLFNGDTKAAEQYVKKMAIRRQGK